MCVCVCVWWGGIMHMVHVKGGEGIRVQVCVVCVWGGHHAQGAGER